jgi:FMN phosphatase YigB (HAD superfamily)
MQLYFLDHFDPNHGLWPIVKSLKSKMKVGLLTDQYPGLLDGIFALNIMPPVDWDVIVDSSVVGERKLRPGIYQFAQDKSAVNPQEILFIDNRPKNLIIPQQLGWQTFFYDSRDYDQANRDLAKFFKL